MRSEKRHLHFFAVFSESISILRNLILPLGVGFFAGLRHLSDQYGYMLAIPLIIVVFGYFKWLRLTYEITDGQFHLQSGVLVRNDRYIRIPRIQSVQVQTNVVLRLFGLVKLKLDTADPANKGDIVLSVLKLEEANRIKQLLGHIDDEQPSAETNIVVNPDSPKKIFRLSVRDFLTAAVTSSSIGIIGVLLAVWSQLDHLVPGNTLGSSFSYLSRLQLSALIPLIVFAVVVLWLISIAVTFIRWGNFRLIVTENQWRIHKGILETSDETYKTDRVQAIRIKEEPLQQLFGLYTVYAECSGSVDSEKGAKGSVLVFPIIRKKELQPFLETIIPRFAGSISCGRMPLRGNFYSMIKLLLFLTVVFAGLSWFFSWGKWLWLTLPIAAVWSFLCFHSSGFRLEENRIVFARRAVAKTSMITLKRHVQTLTRENSRIQQRLGLSSCSVTIRSSHPQSYTADQLESSDAEKLFQWFRA
ncbi:hypothetical protein E4665_09925 [Sporolactobacillus shoreae]|uniref:YdbS-like PH domain-containing protein n=1 Tax=Sporolactobacillus shoreae TaxID=1465501 RepID=A0A4Z0GP34_9BACL|nr:PH domain-containing protein [Sporolactobacillus shoreae]TGA97977.1 hypothetical protein E4665_09925 [Sporolactobacillus shoreae]